MKDIVPAPPPIVRNDAAAVQSLFHQNVVPSYGRFDIVLSHGAGSYVYDVTGRRYLDLGGGIAVSSLGHAHPAITDVLVEQSRRLIHTSNFYYHEPQGRLAQALVGLLGAGKCFFCNSGGEANEGLFKLARKFGHEEGRFEIITAQNSFHGRTLAGISATGQEKVKKGFEPMVAGFRQVPYNDLGAIRATISPATAAVLIEGVQGEGGVTPATPEFLLGLRELCNEHRLLLLMDGVQDGHFRTGRFQSFQRILENVELQSLDGHWGHERIAEWGGKGSEASFLPDGLSMAKSLGAGFPVGAFWVRAPYADLLGAGSHGSTYGGSPLACAVALKVLEVIRTEKLAENARRAGDLLKAGLLDLTQQYPAVFRAVRGLGLMLGVELAPNIPQLPGESQKTQAVRMANLFHAEGLLTIPAGAQILRLLPPLNLRQSEAEEGLAIVGRVAKRLGH
jgi:acetylornithine aminotransferase/acetylornithine/N-succinyldiaminopimelate aminotransferase